MSQQLVFPFKKPLYAWVRSLQGGQPLRIMTLPESPFGVAVRADLIHRVVVWYRAGIRAGTASTKGRGEVMGSGRKLRPNNNLGRARVGDIRSPIRRGGGVSHGPKPKDWAFPLSEPIIQEGFKSVLAAKYKQNELLVIEHAGLELSEPTPGSFTAAILDKSPQLFSQKKKLLFIDTWPFPENFIKATEPLQCVYHATVQDDLNAYHLLNNDLLILTERAVHFYGKKFKVPELPEAVKCVPLRDSVAKAAAVAVPMAIK